jgi:hypothetical protein
VAGHNPFRIILRGVAGNPTAVGARITVSFTDGSTETNEVYAGSGYYSQSTAACFFGYPQANPPVKIQVRWPGGAVTEQTWSANSSTIVIQAPAS